MLPPLLNVDSNSVNFLQMVVKLKKWIVRHGWVVVLIQYPDFFRFFCGSYFREERTIFCFRYKVGLYFYK